MSIERPLRVVIKLGTTSLVDSNSTNRIRISSRTLLDHLVPWVKENHHELLIVSSGAVGLGRAELGLADQLSIPQKQVCASVGQSLLINFYRETLGRHSLKCGQVLLSAEDFSDRKRYQNIRKTLDAQLAMKIVPVINENDTVSIAELVDEPQANRMKDNDHLSALIAAKMDCDWLAIATNVDGLYDQNPSKNSRASRIAAVPSISALQDIKTRGKSLGGRGGMETKIEAARMASLCGIMTYVFDIERASGLVAVLSRQWQTGDEPENGTVIWPSANIPMRKRWVGVSSEVRGAITVNAGAERALGDKKSLLAAGIEETQGQFNSGDILKILNGDGVEIGRGQARLSSAQIEQAKAQKDGLMIHRDQLVLFSEYERDQA